MLRTRSDLLNCCKTLNTNLSLMVSDFMLGLLCTADPQQRLRLFRKLEEVKGVTSVRPPPARVLPRKEYFQGETLLWE